jgi:hypothetical protein
VGRFERWLALPSRQVAVALTAAALVALLSATQLYLNWRSQGFDVGFPRLLVAEGVEWGLWALFVPVVVALDRRLDELSVTRAAVVHGAVAVGWFLVLNLALALLTRFTDPSATAPLGRIYLDRALLRLPSTLAVYLFVVGALRLVKSLVRQERLRRGLAEAQLRNLRAQIQPHFLFNTLHTAASLVRSDDRDGAVHTLVGLSDLLRRSLHHAEQDEVPLCEEISFLRKYLDIQRARFGETLHARVRVASGLESARVPFLLLQPLVENAIRHGLDLDAGPGRVTVAIRPSGACLAIVVEDSGGEGDGDPSRKRPGSHGPEGNGLGVGLDNVRGRLAALYGADHRLEFRTAPRGGTRVEIEIPLRTDDRG